jgi:glutamate formiminotransferase / 5-formyltetrahydrofolate cyclo-ligase
MAEWRGLECVANLSEGRNFEVLGHLTETAGDLLLDLHSDPHHHRSVLTLCSGAVAPVDGESPVELRIRRVVEAALGSIDIRAHSGAHPRIGSVDVVPFVALRRDTENLICDGPISEALEARARFMHWAAGMGIPCFAYGPERTLPDLRRTAFKTLMPDSGPPSPHLSGGACAVGARPILVAYNLWLGGPDESSEDHDSQVSVARSIAARIRSSEIRALGLELGGSLQVSCNLLEPFRTGPAKVYDEVARLAEATGHRVDRTELVGLIPKKVLDSVPRHRRTEIGLDEGRTIEARLEAHPG